jgi:alpha-methylacyl-CoA racemase
MPPQMDRARWPEAKARLAERFRTRTRDAWCALLEGTDACFAPVLSMDEAPDHPHNLARSAFIEIDGVPQPRPAPRFSRTPLADPTPPEPPGAADPRVALAPWGLDGAEVESLQASGLLT